MHEKLISVTLLKQLRNKNIKDVIETIVLNDKFIYLFINSINSHIEKYKIYLIQKYFFIILAKQLFFLFHSDKI